MTDTQKQIIEIAGDKTLSMGCKLKEIYSNNYGTIATDQFIERGGEDDGYKIVFVGVLNPETNHVRNYVYDDQLDFDPEDYGEETLENWYEIIGHPVHFGYIMRLNKECRHSDVRAKFDLILNRFNQNLHLYSQDCLSWDEVTNTLVLYFLQAIKGK